MPINAIYIHIPFCLRRCHYCDFASSVYAPGAAFPYLHALEREAARRAAGAAPRTLYLGGGTPTALSPEELTLLLRLCQPFVRNGLEEFTVEANPGTLTMEKLAILRAGGATRLSLGVQSFRDDTLRLLGRAHSARQARAAVGLAREAGFDRLSLDLICGWPGQTPSAWHDDLSRAVDLDPGHLSAYGLTYEPGTPLARRRDSGSLTPLSPEQERALFDLTGAFLERSGYPRYELSSFARPGRRCRHNCVYWEGGSYLGLGAAAHSFLGGRRSANADDPDGYMTRIERDGTAEVWSETLPPERAIRERAVMWLRLSDGIDLPRFRNETGFDPAAFWREELPPLVQDGWMELTPERLRLTKRALPVADSILAELVA